MSYHPQVVASQPKLSLHIWVRSIFAKEPTLTGFRDNKSGKTWLLWVRRGKIVSGPGGWSAATLISAMISVGGGGRKHGSPSPKKIFKSGLRWSVFEIMFFSEGELHRVDGPALISPKRQMGGFLSNSRHESLEDFMLYADDLCSQVQTENWTGEWWAEGKKLDGVGAIVHMAKHGLSADKLFD